MKSMILPHGEVPLPAFFPDGTRGVVRCVDSADLEGCRVPGLVMNTYHLMTNPGQSTVKSLGGLNSFINWRRPILTDSGGFQVFSLIRENPKFGEIRSNEIIFKTESSGGKTVITPEKCIQSQFAFGSDIMMCLDYCTHPNDPEEINRLSVEITVRWAKRCRDEYLRQKTIRKTDEKNQPLLFGIIQGGEDKVLRRECAAALADIGFAGYGYGGWPLDAQGSFMLDMLEYTAELMPENSIKYAMGVGKPEEIAACCKMGYNLFDCVIPTREARHNRLYIFNEEIKDLPGTDITGKDFYQFYYITDDKYRRDKRPVSEVCDCLCCRNYSRAYLRHLYITGDSLAYRLATIHNLRFYTQLMELIRMRD